MINWELIIAIAGLLIAFAASIATIWQAVLTRKHNKLSVVPHLRIDRVIATGADVVVSLINSGVGPAIINSITISVDGKPIPKEVQDPWEEALKIVSQKHVVRIYAPQSNEVFAANESHNLFFISSTGLAENDYRILLKAFQRITFSISYSSIYGNRFEGMY